MIASENGRKRMKTIENVKNWMKMDETDENV